MKRKITFLSAAFMLLAFLAVPLGMRGQTTYTIGWGTAEGEEGSYTNFTATSGSVEGILSFETAKNASSNNPAYNANANELRLYYNNQGNGGSITITPAEGITITDAVVTTSTTPSVAYYVDGGEAVAVSASGNTYTISDISATTSLEIKNVNTTNTQLRIKTIALTYTTSGGDTPDPDTPTPAVAYITVGEPTGDPLVAEVNEDYQTHEGRLVISDYDGYAIYGTYSFFFEYYTDNTCQETTSQPAMLTTSEVISEGGVYKYHYVMSENEEGEERFAYLKLAVWDNVDYVYSNLVAISQGAAELTPVTYTVSFNVDGGTFVANEVFAVDFVEVEAGNYALPSAEREGYTFDGWNDGTETYIAGYDYTIAADVEFTAQWTENATPTPTPGGEVTDVLNREFTGATGTSYSTWSGKEGESGAVYAGNSAGGNNSIQLRSNNNNSGIVTTTSGGTVTKVVVTWQSATQSGRTLNVYGRNTAYESAANLYGAQTQGDLIGTIVCGTSTELNITDEYEYIGLRSASGAMYLEEIDITWTSESAPVNPAVATSVTISVPEDFNTNLYQGTEAGTLTATVSAGETILDATVTWASSNENVATIDENGVVTLVAVGNTTITASYAGVENEYKPSSATYQLTVINSDPNAPGTVNNPYTVEEAIAAIDELGTIDNAYVEGIVCQVDSYNSSYHSITYWISSDGTTETMLQVYSGKGLEGADFSSVDDMKVNDIVVVTGQLKKYGETYEFNYNNYLVSLVRSSIILTTNIVIPAEGAYASVPVQYENINLSYYPVVHFYNENGEEVDSYDYNWIDVWFDQQDDENVWYNCDANDTEEPRMVYFKVHATDNNGREVTSELVTISQEALTPVLVASITVSPTEVNEDADEHDGTLILTYENLSITDMEDFDVQYYDAEGEEAETPDWIEVLVAQQDPEIGVGYVVSYYMLPNDGEARTVYFKVYAMDANEELVYSNAVTINQAAPVVEQQFALFSGDLIEGDYIIYYDGRAMNNVVSSGRLQYAEVEPEDNVITTDNAAIVWHIAQNADGYWTIYSADANAYAAGTGQKNKAQMLEDGTDDKAMWTVTEIDGTYEFVNKANENSNVNANLRNNGTYGFACYSTSTGGALSLYKYTETVVTYTMEIAGYGDSEGGYYLIASPVLAVTPSVDNGFLTDAFDLYYFDQSQEQEWRNYEAKHFNLVSGKGYLYASQENTTLTFTGAPYTGNGAVTLVKDDNAEWAGWNLVGNPFGEPAYIYNRNFYVMNETGDDIIASEVNGVNAMQGIFVIAENDGENIYFEIGGATGSDPIWDDDDDLKGITLNINHNTNAVIDRAIVRFGEGRQLPKFQLNPNNTKVYIPQGAEDFAVVRSANEGEMPVNFKAKENGNYTISVNADNLNAAYLHLIDNMTGADIDLLLTPSYTFEANAGDNANRFRLVFNVNNSIDDNTVSSNASFAYFNGSEWVISNTGNATLQVVDMMGRVLSTEAISGNATVKVNQVAGVYMLRLVNGNDVKVQKMVVK